MEKHILSKSTFIKGHQCLKALYLHKKRPFLRDKLSAEQIAIFKRGHRVGELAQHLFPGGIDVSPKSPSQYQKSAIRTQELIASGQEVIYEATFQFNKVLVMLDVLVKTDKGWEAYEIKSSLKLSETYFMDAALQYHVITNSGLDLASFYLVYVDKNYQRAHEKEIDLNAYFIKQEVSTEVVEKQNQIAKEIEIELSILEEDHSPKIEVGNHCFSPYNCDFRGFCWKKKPKRIFQLPALTKEEQKNFLDRGILELDAIQKEAKTNTLVQKQIDSIREKQAFISEELKSKLSALPNETVFSALVVSREAIPVCVGNRAYQNQVFAYSILSAEQEESKLYSGRCSEYLAFIEDFLHHLNQAPQLLVYDKVLLADVLVDAQSVFPDLKSQSEEILKKTEGIKQWIEEGLFFFPGLKHDLVFNEVVGKILNTFAFAKQAIYADVLAINKYVAFKKKEDFSEESSEAIAIRTYTKNKAVYIQRIVHGL